MKKQIVYLDSSAIVKRYIKEPGSSSVRETYLKAYSGDLIIAYNIWNIGEVLGVFDKAKNMDRIDEEIYKVARRRFLNEVKRTAKVGSTVIIPLKIEILIKTWRILEKHHIYEADALQIASAIYINATQFLTGDETLHETATKEKLSSIYLR